MAAPATFTPRTPRLRRALSWAGKPVRLLVQHFVHAPRLLQILLGVLALGTLAAGGATYSWYQNHLRNVALATGWTDFTHAQTRGDVAQMTAALQRILAVNPGDTRAARKFDALERQDADPDDAELAAVLVNEHMRANRLFEMAREAHKVLAHHPHDWRSLCVLAHYEWQRDGLAAALARLERLPDPEAPGARVDVGGLLYSLQLFAGVGKDTAPLRGLIVRRLLPVLRGGAAGAAPAATKAQLVECYLEPFTDPSHREVLGQYWADASRLADQATEAALDHGDQPTLIRIGHLGPRMLVALAGLKARQNQSLSAERYALLRKEILGRTQRAWDAVLQRQPDMLEAHLGRVRLAWAIADAGAVRTAILEGLRACGDRAELLHHLAILGIQAGQADAVLNVVWASARRSATDVPKWLLAARVAQHARRPGLVIEACETALRLEPNHPQATLLLADWHLDRGESEKALQLLGCAAFMPRLTRHPEFARRQARALTALTALPDSFLNEIIATAAAEKRSPVPVMLAALHGMADVQPPRPERDARIAALARELAAQEPDSSHAVEAGVLAAQSLARQAEFQSPAWPASTVHAALQAVDLLPAEVKMSFPMRGLTARLQLYGLKDAALAVRTAAPLLDDRLNPSLTPQELELLGTILLRTGQRVEAVELLESAAARPQATPGVWIALALARQAAGQPGEARAALDVPMIRRLPFTPREHAAWASAARRLQPETP